MVTRYLNASVKPEQSVNLSILEEQDLSFWQLAGVSLLMLLLGHGLIKEYWSLWSYPIGAIMAGVFLMVHKRSNWSVLLLLFVLNHFPYRDSAGGIWSYFIVLMGIASFFSSKRKDFSRLNNFLLGLIMLSSVGCFLLRPPLLKQDLFAGLISVASSLLFLLMVSRIKITSQRTTQLFKVIIGLALVQFIVTVNQYFLVIKFPFYTPIFPESIISYPGSSELDPAQLADVFSNRPLGMFSNFELTAEWAGLVACLILPWLYSRKRLSHVGIVPLVLALGLSITIIVITASRAPFLILSVLIFLLLYGVLLTTSLIDRDAYLPINFLRTLTVAILLILVLVGYMGFEDLKVRILETSFVGIVPNNRVNAWEGAIQAIKDTFPLGIGPLRPVEFREAVGGRSPHSIYLSGPLYYGLPGVIAFGILFFNVVLSLWRVRKTLDLGGFYHTVATSLLLFWLFFLLDEYKIDMFRRFAYQNIVYFFLGFTYAFNQAMRDTGGKASSVPIDPELS